MAKVYRNTDPEYAALIADFNTLKSTAGAGASFHLDKSEVTVTSGNATDLPTAIALLQECMGVYAFHTTDTLAHKVADVTDVVSETVNSVIDLASAITAANDLKAKRNLHIASTTYHYTADATNATSSPDATDLASLITLVNEIKADQNAHMASGPATASKRLVSA